MALGYSIKVTGLYGNNDSALYYGVTGVSLGGDLHTLTLTGVASASNFGASTTVDLMKVQEVTLYKSAQEFPPNAPFS